MGPLDRFRLEHGLRRRASSSAGQIAFPALHEDCADSGHSRKTVPAIDAAGNYSVRVPSLRIDSSGVTWRSGTTPGRSIPISHFYIAHPGVDTAVWINQRLAKGKDLLLTPGIYDLMDAIRVTRPSTTVMGLGFATLRPINGIAAITTADADGIVVAGLLFDAGPVDRLSCWK